MKKKWKMFFLFLILVGVSCVPGGGNLSDRCGFMPESARPLWTEKNMGIDGYYTGTGQAEKSEKGFIFQLKTAKQRAVADLSENIKVRVQSELEIEQVSEQRRGKAVPPSQWVHQKVKTASQIVLNDIRDAGKWLDTDHCLLWVRVKVERSLVDNLLKLDRAEKLYRPLWAGNKNISPAMGLKNIDEALLLLENVDFNRLPAHYGNKQFYLSRYKGVKKRLVRQNSRRETVYVVTGSNSFPEHLKRELAERFMPRTSKSSFYLNADGCGSKALCLEHARANNARHMVMINAETFLTSGTLGTWKGELEISVSAYDVETGGKIAEDCKKKESIFSFDRDQIHWFLIVEKLFKEDAFGEIINRLKHL